MEIASLALIAIGALIAVIYGIQLLIAAFRTSFLWGLGSLVVPLVSILFVVTHWDQAKKPFLLQLLCIPFLGLGFLLAPSAT
jgi:hypothetical protein